ncbi:Nn.00g081130.m01.CDS01 [Neocucurbitaria sp. VM-36]
MNRRSQNPDNPSSDETNDDDDDDDDDGNGHAPYLLRQMEVKKAWDQLYDSNEHLLFCSRNISVDLSTLHPSQAHIFKIWQVYLDNVNPLLKVTHTPTLQARFIDAASDVTNISPPLEALMFGIYCISVLSLRQEECYKLFGTSRQDTLRGYQLGAREALLNSNFLRSGDRDCLTALFLYLISVKPATDPRSLSSMLGSAIRIAQRMGIHTEAANAKHNALEAEMRRRLWWSLILFDSRISEMTEFTMGMLLPTWDCKVPLNVNDFDLRAEMKNPPPVYSQSSEAVFAVMRGEVGDFTRHSAFHLDFVNPALSTIARRASMGPNAAADELEALERVIEEKYLSACDPDNPLHFMTMWTARSFVARSRFVKHLSIFSRSIDNQTDVQREAGVSHALRMLECDTKLMASEPIKGFRWLILLHFPFPAYVHVVQELRQRPLGRNAERCWDIMSDNCTARFMDIDNKDNHMQRKDNPFFKIFASVVLEAWTAREEALAQLGQQAVPPPIVAQVQKRMESLQIDAQNAREQQQDSAIGTPGNTLPPPELMAFGGFNSLYHIDGDGFSNTGSGLFPAAPAQAPVAFNGNQWGWPAPNWNSMLGMHGW